MGRAPCCDKTKVKRGPWSPDEDDILRNYLQKYGTAGNWIALPQKAGLKRCGKSCRLRWLNYLRPNIKHGGYTEEEDNTILSLYTNIGSRWSVIASHLPGRTDNDVKNHWNTKLKKRLSAATVLNKTTTTSTPTNYSNCNISADNSYSTHFGSSTTVLADDNNYRMLSDSIQLPIPPLMEVQENVTNSYADLSDLSVMYQEVSSLSCSFSAEKNCTLWYGNGGGVEDDKFLVDLGVLVERSSPPSYDFKNEFNFQEKTSGEASPDLCYFSPHSSLLATISDNSRTVTSQGFHETD